MDFLLKNSTPYSINIYKLWNKTNYKVQVNYVIYNKKKKQILKYGCSKPSGVNKYHTSVHAEITAYFNYINIPNAGNNIIIIIFKFDINKKVIPAYSCLSCSKFIAKNNISHIYYTIKENKLISSIVNEPKISFGMFLKFKK